MGYLEYEKAKKMGDKAFRQAVQKGRSPYLPVLDEILSQVEIRGEVNLGLVNIPLSRVVGTSTQGRTTAFANNFMPILGLNTEFGVKWNLLSDAHMEEGIHDPIKVYEYMNYYYVIEGNKRVSVLKFFDAASVPAIVIRKLPARTDDLENRIYYEFMDFNKITGINIIWFSKEGNFKKLVAEAGKEFDPEGPKWDDDSILNLTSAYYNFSKAFEEKGGKKLENITTGDALLAFIEAKEYGNVISMTKDEMKRYISEMWEEFVMMNKNSEVEVSLDPPEEKKASLISNIFSSQPSASNPLKVAFIYDRDPATSDWLYGHELGRTHLKETFGDNISTIKITTADTEENAIQAMEDLINKEKVEVIFVTTSKHVEASFKMAVKYPNVKILNCSLNTSHRYIRTYYARLYETKFLSGIIAGALTTTGKLGYIADYPIYGVTANINAFALGAKMVNPTLRVYLRWTTEKGASRNSIYHDFFEQGIDYVSDQDMITPKHASRRFGMYRIMEDEPINIAMPVINWGVLYEKIVKLITSGSWNSSGGGERAINYWWGMSAGVTDIIISNKAPQETVRLVEFLKNMIIKGEFAPFEGEIKDQKGNVVNQPQHRVDIENIIKMDWLVDNVEGQIPDIENLEEKARDIVELKGVLNDDDEDISIS